VVGFDPGSAKLTIVLNHEGGWRDCAQAGSLFDVSRYDGGVWVGHVACVSGKEWLSAQTGRTVGSLCVRPCLRLAEDQEIWDVYPKA
jgi:hypothetical protein